MEPEEIEDLLETHTRVNSKWIGETNANTKAHSIFRHNETEYSGRIPVNSRWTTPRPVSKGDGIFRNSLGRQTRPITRQQPILFWDLLDDPDQKLKWCFLVSITATYSICTHAHMCVFKYVCLLHNTFSYFFSNILGIIYLSSPLSLCITLPHPSSVKSLASLHIYPLPLPSNYDLLSPSLELLLYFLSPWFCWAKIISWPVPWGL